MEEKKEEYSKPPYGALRREEIQTFDSFSRRSFGGAIVIYFVSGILFLVVSSKIMAWFGTPPGTFLHLSGTLVLTGIEMYILYKYTKRNYWWMDTEHKRVWRRKELPNYPED